MLLRDRPLKLFVLAWCCEDAGKMRLSPLCGSKLNAQFVLPKVLLVPHWSSTAPVQISVAGAVRSSNRSNHKRFAAVVMAILQDGANDQGKIVKNRIENCPKSAISMCPSLLKSNAGM